MEDKLAIFGGTPVRGEPLSNLFPGAAVMGEEEKGAVLTVLDNQSPFRYYGRKVVGTVRSFERDFARYLGAKYALGVSSGTASLVVALKALGIGPGDHVLVPACTFIASAGSVICAGAIPVFVDIDDSFNMDPDDLERRITKRTRAVMTVAWRGNPCEMERIMQVAKKHNLAVVEDIAQSVGSKYRGKACGTFGDVGCFSLQLNKLITSGDGGALCTDDGRVFERAVRYHDHGSFRERSSFPDLADTQEPFVGQNYRMNELSGAVAGAQLKKLDSIKTNLRKIIFSLCEAVGQIRGISLMRFTDREGYAGSTFVMLLPSRDLVRDFVRALNGEGIPALNIYGGNPIYLMPQIHDKRTADRDNFPFISPYADGIEYATGLCPRAEDIIGRNVSVDVSPVLRKQDLDDIVTAIRKVARYYL
ncbi:MAG TPA: DegT/DnrJ/EryC1/StrS family aminotransferase [Spirochaetia bacterium]|nr:DegT/DnrJ/EryC1/StrS family aminotransferase [Spirochaetia bacterium]